MTTDMLVRDTATRNFHDRLEAEAGHPALVAEQAIRRAIDAARRDDADRVHVEVEYAKFALISRRCGMDPQPGSLNAILHSPGISLCSGLSNVSEMAQADRLEGVVSILAEAAVRAHALAR